MNPSAVHQKSSQGTFSHSKLFPTYLTNVGSGNRKVIVFCYRPLLPNPSPRKQVLVIMPFKNMEQMLSHQKQTEKCSKTG